MPRANLRQLSRQLARGVISREDYRQQRAALIESMLELLERDTAPTGAADAGCADNGPDTEVPSRGNSR